MRQPDTDQLSQNNVRRLTNNQKLCNALKMKHMIKKFTIPWKKYQIIEDVIYPWEKLTINQGCYISLRSKASRMAYICEIHQSINNNILNYLSLETYTTTRRWINKIHCSKFQYNRAISNFIYVPPNLSTFLWLVSTRTHMNIFRLLTCSSEF